LMMVSSRRRTTKTKMEIPQGARKMETETETELRTIYLALALALALALLIGGEKTSGHRRADERELQQSNPRRQ